MKRGQVLTALIFLVLVINFVSAIDTEIIVKTLPDHNVMISALRVSENPYDLIESFHLKSDEEGTTSTTLSSSEESFNLAIWIKKGNDVVKYEKFENSYPAGTPVELEMYPDWYIKQKEIEAEFAKRAALTSANLTEEESSSEVTENQTETETTSIPTTEDSETPAEEETNSSEITPGISFFNVAGSAVFGDDGLLSKKTLYYIIGGILLLAIFIACLKFTLRKMKGKSGTSFAGTGDEERIKADERKIKEAREEIERLKNKSQDSEKEKKIAEAKKKLIEDEKALMKLRNDKE